MAEENLNLMASCIYANKFTRSGASAAQKHRGSREPAAVAGKLARLMKPEQFRHVQKSVGASDPRIPGSFLIFGPSSF